MFLFQKQFVVADMGENDRQFICSVSQTRDGLVHGLMLGRSGPHCLDHETQKLS